MKGSYKGFSNWSKILAILILMIVLVCISFLVINVQGEMTTFKSLTELQMICGAWDCDNEIPLELSENLDGCLEGKSSCVNHCIAIGTMMMHPNCKRFGGN